MKLVKQASLAFRQGTSDKVYEVDLCEVGPDQYVVNFRYGRRGSSLRDGSKTVVAVPRAEAEKVFDKLVNSKVTKGYQHVENIGAAAAPAPAPAAPAPSAPTPRGVSAERRARDDARDDNRRAEAVLNRLRLGDRRGDPWPLDRAIWRAGELGIAEAETLLTDLLGARGRGRDQQLRRYCLVWALGRCGSARTISHLVEIYNRHSEKPATRAIAAEGLRRLYSEETRATFVENLIDSLPQGLRDLARSGPAERFTSELRRLIDQGDAAALEALQTAYLIDNEHVRPGVLQLLSEVPMDRDLFQRMRHIFKAAEFRRDGRVFGLLAHRFETSAAKGYRDWRSHRNIRQFSVKTRQYLRLRAWRTLRRLGELSDPDWIKMAVGVLLPFSDSDAAEVVTRTYHPWRGQRYSRHWGPFAPYWAFNHLLYRNGSRFTPDHRGRVFRASSAAAHQEEPASREEAFPELWDEAPFGLLHLLDESACEPVHHFAVKALRDNRPFCEELDLDALLMLLSRPYEVTAQLGFELAERRYDPAAPDNGLVRAVATCAYQPARRAAQRWIEGNRSHFIEDSELVAALAISPHEDNRRFARDLLRSSVLSDRTARLLVGRIFAALLALGPDDGERAADVADTVLKCFSQQLASIGIDVVRDLMSHPLSELHELAGDLLLTHAQLAHQAPDDLLMALLSSPSESVRGIGARLVGQLPDSDLARRPELLFNLTTHEHEDLRHAIRPVLERLAATQPAFAGELGAMLIEALRRKAGEGVHSHLVSVLRKELRGCLPAVSKDDIFSLLQSKYPQAQELGGVLLASNLSPEELTIKEIVRLASHEILSVRQACWEMSRRSVDRMRRGVAHAVRLLDAKWEDSRRFAFEFFRDNFDQTQLTPQILVSICDSVREDVQAFGREMITRYFAEEHGLEYLLKLSEHPAEALQLFASNYLERFAADDLERLAHLEPYFVGILSRVNKGRVAKQRSIQFLEREALKSEEAARIVAGIFTRQSVTMAIGDKAKLIEGMLRIHRQYPGIELPIHLRPVGPKPEKQEARHGV